VSASLRSDQLIKVLLLSAISFSILVSVLWLFLSVKSVPGHKELETALVKQLRIVVPLTDLSENLHAQSNAMIYTLGGSQKSLQKKFETAAELYHHGLGKKIVFLSESGITAFDPLLGRNLTKDEWAIKRLTSLGVKREDVEPLYLKKGFLGTLREARKVSQLVSERNYNVLILVCSPYHAMRVKTTFSYVLKDNSINIFVYPSDDGANLRALLLEYLKLNIYKYFLL
jgi:uncharacterized SAM-binding protein YcdF (DUF218 family)